MRVCGAGRRSYPIFTIRHQSATIWPPPPAALAALMDLGLSPALIAKYFSVSENQVGSLLDEYGKAHGGHGAQNATREATAGS